MTRPWLLPLVMLPLFAPTCGPDSPEAEFADDLPGKLCDASNECLAAENLDPIDCGDLDDTSYDPCEEFCEFDAEAAEECLDALDQGSCDGAFVDLPAACLRVYSNCVDLSDVCETLVSIGGGDECTATDPLDDCGASSNTTADTCVGGADIAGLVVDDSEEDRLYVDVAYREPAIQDPGENRLRYGISLLNEHPASDTVSFELVWDPGTQTWSASGEFGLTMSTQEDYVFDEDEGLDFAGDGVRLCIKPSKVAQRFDIAQLGTSVSLTYPDSTTQFDKLPNVPYTGCQ